MAIMDNATIHKELKTEIVRPASKARDVAINGLLIALVFIATRFINVRLPISINGGLIHVGTLMLFIAALTFGPKRGAIAGSFGMALFDVLSGWGAWAPFTFIVRGLMGFVVGSVANIGGKKGNSFMLNVFAIAASVPVIVVGYYVTEIILYGNIYKPMTSVPGNLIQVLIGIPALIIVPALKKSGVFNDFK